jgi:hypothetical protein
MPNALLFDTGEVQAAARVEPRPAPPSDDELGCAVMLGARLAVNKDYFGALPSGMDRDALVSLVIELALPRCRKWRAGGPKLLGDFCYYASKCALISWLRHRAVLERDELGYLDVLDCRNTIPLDDAPPLQAAEIE